MPRQPHLAGWAQVGLRLGAVALLAAWTPPAVSAPAPLDTLQAGGQAGTGERPGFDQTPVNISRALLPEAKATTVPSTATPSTPPRLDDPVAGAWRYHQARQAALDGNALGVRENLTAAFAAAPAQPSYRWWQSLVALKSFDGPTLVKAVPAGVRALADSPVGRGQMLITLQQAGILAVGLFWTVLVVGLYLAQWRYLAHDGSALLLKNRAHTPLRFLPLFLPLAALACKPGWFGLLAVVSVPLVALCRGRGRGLLLATWMMALVLVFPSWPLLRSAVPTIDPRSEVLLLDRACNLPPAPALTDELQARLAQTEDALRRARLNTALGIQEARRGRYTQSNLLFQDVLKSDPSSLPALVGLANNTYYLGDLDEAVAIYQKAARQHPECGEVFYNLAQVYFKKLFVPEATEAMETARRLGYVPFKGSLAAPSQQTYAAVAYPGLTAAAMEEACRAEAGNYPPEVTIAGWRALLGAPPLALYLLVGVPLVLSLLIITGQSGQARTRECQNCGVPLCRTCCKIRDGSMMCAACGEVAQRAQSEMILATLLKNRSRAEGMAYTQRIVRLGRLLPGAGHLASGRLGAAWLRLSLVAAGLFLITCGWAFDPGAEWDRPGLLLPVEMIHPTLVPLPAAGWPGLTGMSVLTGIALLGLAWLTAWLDGPNLRRGIPDRYSLIPTTAHQNAEPQYGPAMR